LRLCRRPNDGPIQLNQKILLIFLWREGRGRTVNSRASRSFKGGKEKGQKKGSKW